MALDAATEAAIKLDYEESDLTLDRIGKKHGRSGAWVCKLARLRRWKRRRKQTVPSDLPPRRRRPRNVRSVIDRRMCNIISRKLKQMETGMKTGALTSADLDRDAKWVGSMLGGMGKVNAPAERDEASDPNIANAGAQDEVERLQREIIERFERILRRRDAARGSA